MAVRWRRTCRPDELPRRGWSLGARKTAPARLRSATAPVVVSCAAALGCPVAGEAEEPMGKKIAIVGAGAGGGGAGAPTTQEGGGGACSGSLSRRPGRRRGER